MLTLQSTLYSVRNRTLVLTDWLKVKLFGRYVIMSIQTARTI